MLRPSAHHAKLASSWALHRASYLIFMKHPGVLRCNHHASRCFTMQSTFNGITSPGHVLQDLLYLYTAAAYYCIYKSIKKSEINGLSSCIPHVLQDLRAHLAPYPAHASHILGSSAHIMMQPHKITGSITYISWLKRQNVRFMILEYRFNSF